MKKSIIIAAALAAALTSCQKEQLREADSRGVTIRAARESCIGTKATVSDDGVFSWSVADAFGLYANGKFYDFTTSESGTTAAFTGNYVGEIGGYAVFPNNLKPSIGENVSVTLPSEYAWEANIINTPMLATFTSGANADIPSKITFYHLGGLLRVSLRNIPAGATKFVFSTTNNMPVTGTFTAEKESSDDADSKLQIKSAEASGTTANSVAFTFEASKAATEKSFYIPLPVGKYAVKIALYDDSNAELWSYSGTKEHEITRAKYIQTTRITIASTNAGGEDSAVSQEVPANYSGTYYLPNTTANVYLTMNSTSNEVTIAYANSTDAKKPENVYIDCGGNTIKTLNVDLSESHVEISGNEDSGATLGTLNTKTSNSTLVLEKTVTIGEKLTVAAGSVEIAGAVKDVEVENTVDAEVTVKVTEDATVSGTLSVAKAASVEVAGTVETVAVKTDVSSVTIASAVKNVEVSKADESESTVKTVIWVTESGSVTGAVKDNTNTGTDASGSSISIVATNTTAGTGTGQINKVTNSSGGDVSDAVKTPSAYMADQIKTGGTVTLENNITGDFTIESGEAVINLNGKTVSNSESDKVTFTVAEGASLTINGEGYVTNTADGKPAIVNNGTLTINGGTYSGVASAIELRAGALTIKDGSFTASATDFSETGSEGFNTISGAAIAVSQYSADKDVKLAVAGGTFSGQKAIYENDSRTDKTTNVDIYIDSHLNDIGEVSIKHKIPYLTFSADKKQGFSMQITFGTPRGKILYSLGGGDWKAVVSRDIVWFGGELGDLRLRAKSEIGTATSTSNYSRTSFKYSSVPVTLTGDIRTLIDWENYNTTSTAKAAFTNLFYGCYALTSAPTLPATELAPFCYYGMFKSCTSLTEAPKLPATTLVNRCYTDMFRGCKSLTAAPELPATDLAPCCYSEMFYDCTSLTAAPKLPATTLENSCYREMFRNCPKITSVTIKATSSAVAPEYGILYALENWLYGTASEGTVYAPAETITCGEETVNLSDYLPSGWTLSTSAE